MRQVIVFGVGVAARFVAVLAEHFAQWIFYKVSEGAEAGLDLFSDIWEFGESFFRMLADQFGGRSMRRFNEEGW